MLARRPARAGLLVVYGGPGVVYGARAPRGGDGALGLGTLPSVTSFSDSEDRPASGERLPIAAESDESRDAPQTEPAAPDSELSAREDRQRERESRRREHPQGMVPGRERRRSKVERGAMRLLATGGIIGVAVAMGAVLVGQDVAGWIVGLAVGLTSVILAALLWSSRQL